MCLTLPLHIITGCVKVSQFLFREDNDQWVEDQKLEAHTDWVRDVAWAPSIGLMKNIIASCSQVHFLLSLVTVNKTANEDYAVGCTLHNFFFLLKFCPSVLHVLYFYL